MYKNYKIISVTPAGRKRYLKILDFYLRKNKNIIDKHIFWVNTKNQEDIDYMKYLVKKYPEFYELEYLNQDSKETYNNYSVKNIHNFFKNCIDENTIYVRFDDDICFIDQNAIQNLIDCRIANPEFFIVYPLIINNCFMIDLLQQKNLSSNKHGVAGESRVGKGWQDPLIGKNIHEEFLQNIIDNKIEIYNFGNHIIENFTPVSINSFCWFGKEFKKFQGNVHEDEELWLSHIKPSLIDKKNLICTSAVVSHFSFQSQNNYFETEKKNEKQLPKCILSFFYQSNLA